MFLSYVKSVLEAIRSRFPDVRLIMWDDMFREAPVDVLLGMSTFILLLAVLSSNPNEPIKA